MLLLDHLCCVLPAVPACSRPDTESLPAFSTSQCSSAIPLSSLCTPFCLRAQIKRQPSSFPSFPWLNCSQQQPVLCRRMTCSQGFLLFLLPSHVREMSIHQHTAAFPQATQGRPSAAWCLFGHVSLSSIVCMAKGSQRFKCGLTVPSVHTARCTLSLAGLISLHCRPQGIKLKTMVLPLE